MSKLEDDGFEVDFYMSVDNTTDTNPFTFTVPLTNNGITFRDSGTAVDNGHVYIDSTFWNNDAVISADPTVHFGKWSISSVNDGTVVVAVGGNKFYIDKNKVLKFLHEICFLFIEGTEEEDG